MSKNDTGKNRRSCSGQRWTEEVFHLREKSLTREKKSLFHSSKYQENSSYLFSKDAKLGIKFLSTPCERIGENHANSLYQVQKCYSLQGNWYKTKYSMRRSVVLAMTMPSTKLRRFESYFYHACYDFSSLAMKNVAKVKTTNLFQLSTLKVYPQFSFHSQNIELSNDYIKHYFCHINILSPNLRITF